MAFSTALGPIGEIDVPGGTVRYRERGEGPLLVFVHGAMVNGDLWRHVVPELAGRFRCVTPDWPLGAHHLPMDPGADLTPAGVAQVVLDFLDGLGAGDVTLVGNDTGTAIIQLVLARQPARVRRVVLSNGAAFTHFFPPAFKPMTVLAHVPGAFRLMGAGMRTPRAKRMGYVPLSRSLRDPAVLSSYTDPARAIPAVRRDLRKFMGSVRSRYTVDAAAALPAFEGPVLLAWGEDDTLLPLDLAQRLARLFRHAELVTIPRSRTYVPEDNPAALVAAMDRFLAATA